MKRLPLKRNIKKRAVLVAVAMLAALISIGGAPALADPTTLYVDDDDHTCGDNSPCYSTIQAAIADANRGDTINVAAGTYNENLNIDNTKDNLTLQGEHKVRTKIYVTAHYGVKIYADNVTFDGFMVKQDAASVVAKGLSLMNGATGNIVSNCIFDGTGSTKSPSMGILVRDDNNTIDSVKSFGWTAYGIYVYSVRAPYPDDCLIKNSNFHDNGRFNVAVDHSTNVTVENCTTRGDGTSIAFFEKDGAPVTGGKVISNTISNATYDGVLLVGSGVLVAGNDISGCSTTTDPSPMGYGAIRITTNERPYYAANDNTVTNNNIHDNNGNGVLIDHGGHPEPTGNVFYCNNIVNNKTGFDASTLTSDVVAEYNWWGDDSGPLGEGLGTGDAVSVNVDYDPWLASLVDDVCPLKLAITPGTVPPSDVLEQVDFLVPTAGIVRCMSTEITEEMVEVGEPVTWCACGFEEGEEFLIRVINPKGETVVKLERTAEKTVFGDTCQEGLLSRNTFLPDDPMGQYTVEIIGQDSTLTLTFTLVPPSRPTILSTDTGYVLAGFDPFERVRLLGFKYHWPPPSSFIGEWWVEVNQEGILYIEVDTSVEMYAIGTESGEAPPGGNHLFSKMWVNYEGELAYGAAVDATDQLSIRSVPALGGDLIATVPVGTRMQIAPSWPMSNNDTFWWKVRLEDGKSGWADENSLRLVDYEPNDTLETAAKLFLFPPGEDQAGYRASALRIDPGDEDWFALPLAAGQLIGVNVISELMELELGELGIALYSGDGRQLAVGRKVGDRLSLDLKAVQSGTYYLRIYGQTGSEKDTYTIEIDIW
jgi:hypothetical protein